MSVTVSHVCLLIILSQKLTITCGHLFFHVFLKLSNRGQQTEFLLFDGQRTVMTDVKHHAHNRLRLQVHSLGLSDPCAVLPLATIQIVKALFLQEA